MEQQVDTSATKRCMKCRQVKPLADFYRHPETADGHLGKCKECAKIDATLNRLRRLEKCREYDRGRSRRHTGRKKLSSLHMAAHNAAMRAVRRGILVRPAACSKCGDETKLHAHHEDYNKPLEVLWLCYYCHMVLHNAYYDPAVAASTISRIMGEWFGAF